MTLFNFLSDVDECVEAALERRTICPHSAYCVNNPGGYECTCLGDTQLIDGECIQCEYVCIMSLNQFQYCILMKILTFFFWAGIPN